MKGIQYYHDRCLTYSPNYPKFSEELSEGLYRGSTVTYSGLQLAACLGAKEIYLIGVDNNYSKDIDEQEKSFYKRLLF